MTSEGSSPQQGPGSGGWTDELKALILSGRFPEADQLVTRHRGATPPPGKLELALRQRWGFTLLEQGALAAAEVQLRAAAELAPQDAAVQADLAFVQLRAGRYAEAARTLTQVLALDPEHQGALANLGAAWMALKQPDAAEAIYRRLLAVDASNAAALRNLGVLLNGTERSQEALAVADASLAKGPNAAALALRAAALYDLGRYEASLEACRQATDAGGDAYELLTRQGLALNALGRFTDALAAFDAAVSLRPNEHLAYHRRAPVRLLTGDFSGGWRDYEARWRDEAFVREAAGPRARGLMSRFESDIESLNLGGRRVLVVGEQGIGDEVMFASMLPDLAREAAAVACVCDRRLVRLFVASMPKIRFIAASDPQLSADDYDVVLPAGSLGRRYRNRRDSFPGAAYLWPSAAAVARWAERLGQAPSGGRIGVGWRGGMPRTRRAQRSIPLTDMLGPLEADGREFVSLQYGEAGPDVGAAKRALGVDVRLFDAAEIDDFEDLAAIIANLDAVVTVQTALVHLAGATGARCLTLAPQVAEWRYMASGPSMPWYRSVRLFRQGERGAWAPVLAEAGQWLTQSLRPGRP